LFSRATPFPVLKRAAGSNWDSLRSSTAAFCESYYIIILLIQIVFSGLAIAQRSMVLPERRLFRSATSPLDPPERRRCSIQRMWQHPLIATEGDPPERRMLLLLL
jgi:hypothetical protein